VSPLVDRAVDGAAQAITDEILQKHIPELARSLPA